MSLIHGRDITAEELERIVGREFRIQRFASLCNAIVWATAKPRGLSQLLFTERVYVSDSGIDAEWVLDVGDDVQVQNHIGFGRNVFQSKQRDVTARDRNRIVGDLVRDLHGAIVDVVARTGRAVDRYVLLTNVDLTLDESRRLHDAISADHADAQVGSEVPLRAEIPGGAEGECGQRPHGATDMDLEPVPEGIDDRGEIAQVLVAGVDADQVVEPIGELDQHAHGDLVTH